MSTMTMAPPLTAAGEVDSALAQRGFAIVDALQSDVLMDVSPATWASALTRWADGWNRLAADEYLRDGGRYRHRRHGSFVVEGERITAAPQRAHWQPLEYNALHGGIERWFEPLEPGLLADPDWQRWLVMLGRRASALRAQGQTWYVEAHQFRIDTAGGIGRPTPEGAHRDGVDLVAVTLVDRVGVKGGETRVFDAGGPAGLRFTMDMRGQTLLLDDAHVIHETTPIQPMEGAHDGHRDTLVITLRSGGFQGP